MYLANSYPNQRISFKEKKAKDWSWGKSMIDYIIDSTREDTFQSEDRLSRYNRMMSNYRLYANEVETSDWERLCNPLGFEVGQAKDEIQPYNIAYNKIYTLLGEEWKRPFNFRAVLINEEGTKQRDRKKTQLLHEYTNFRIQQEMEFLSQSFQKANPQQDASSFPTPQALDEYLQQYKQQIQEHQSKVLNPQEIEKFLKTKFLSSKEITANKILEYGKKVNDFKGKKLDGFQHGLISGEEHLWIGSRHNEPVIDNLNSPNIFYHKSPDVKYIQYGLYAGYSTMMSIGDIMDKFGEFLEEGDIRKLQGEDIPGVSQAEAPKKEMIYNHSHLALRRARTDETESSGQYGFPSAEDYLVTHVEWKSEDELAFLTYPDPETGEPVKEIVDGSYKPNLELGETIEKVWLPVVYEGVRIEGDIYCCIGPKEYQFRDLDNPYKVKLGYHGVVYHNMNSTPISMMERMKPFQYLYFFTMHKMLKLIARDRGKVMPFDTSMLPPKMNLEKVLFYLDELDIYLYNPLQGHDQPGASLASHRGVPGNSIDRSHAQHIINYISILNYLEDKIGEVGGVNRNREGQSSPYETATNAQQNIVQSSHITETYFIRHNQLWEEALNTYLTAAEESWRGQSISKSYLLDDLSVNTLALEKDFFDDASFGVYVTDSGAEEEVLRAMKQHALSLVQNEKMDDEGLAEMMSTNSLELLKREISSAKEVRQQLLQLQQQEQFQAEAEAKKADIDMKTKELELKDTISKRDSETKIRVAEIQTFIGKEDTDEYGEEGVPDFLELTKIRQKQNEFTQKMSLEYEKLKSKREETANAIASKEKMEKTKLAENSKLKDKEIKAKKDIAKSKPKTTTT